MNPDKTAALQAAPQEDTDLNAPSVRPQTALVPQQEENVPAVTPNRTDSAPDSAAYPELKMPEDVSFPEGALEEFKTLSQEMGLSAEQVQKLLDLEARYARSGEQHRAAVRDRAGVRRGQRAGFPRTRRRSGRAACARARAGQQARARHAPVSIGNGKRPPSGAAFRLSKKSSRRSAYHLAAL